MKPPVLPSDKEIEELVRETQKNLPDFKNAPKACVNCASWIPEYQYCPINDKQSPGYMVCNHHKTIVKHLVEIAKKNLLWDATECKKIQYLMSSAFAYADMTMKVIADMERRVNKQREGSTDGRERNLLKRDTDMCEAFEGAFKVIKQKIREIEQQYEWYVQPYFNKAFKDEEGYDTKNGDLFNSDTGEFIINNLVYQRCCYKNEENTKKIAEFMSSLKNDQYFPLTDKDISHYSVKL